MPSQCSTAGTCQNRPLESASILVAALCAMGDKDRAATKPEAVS